MADDWFRNEKWSAEIEKAFFDKLKRARQKNQYLRIQASTLSRSHPEIALKLLDQYFSLGEDFDYAQAYVDQANAYLSLNQIEDSLKSFEAALNREDEFPNLKTQAYIDFPFVIAMRKLESRYKQALEVLNKNKARLMFPIDFFKWHAANALILKSQQQFDEARIHAIKALEAASKEKSGFTYHPNIGLVSDSYNELKNTLALIAK